MFEHDDSATIPRSQALQLPVDFALTPSRLAMLFAAGLATDWDIAAFDRGEGWLNLLSSYRFGHSFTIEGPSALYGGPFSPNAWTGTGGLCAIGSGSYSHSPLPKACALAVIARLGAS